jgi:hypothetical protein
MVFEFGLEAHPRRAAFGTPVEDLVNVTPIPPFAVRG